MRWFVRVAAAVTLSALAVAALTWAGWPRPRFKVVLPGLTPETDLPAVRDWYPNSVGSPGGPPGDTASRPWFGLLAINRRPGEERPLHLWFMNLDDGRLCGPWDGSGVRVLATDWRGAAVAAKCGVSQPLGGGIIGRFEPATGEFRPLATDRDRKIRASGNGETLLTFSLPRDQGTAETGDADLVCFDLTADPPTRTRMDLVVPGHLVSELILNDRLHTRPFTNGRADGLGGVALSPDGRTLAVSEAWRGNRRAGPHGITFFDTRTGHRTGAVTDYGPPPDGLKGAAPGDTGAFRLAFSRDSRHLDFDYSTRGRYVWDAVAVPVHFVTDASKRSTLRTVNVETGKLAGPDDPVYRMTWSEWSGVLSSLCPNGDGKRVEFVRGEVNDIPLSRLLAADGSGRPVLTALPPYMQPRGQSGNYNYQGANYAEYFDFWVAADDGTESAPRRPLIRESTGQLRYGTGSQFVPGTNGLAWVTKAQPEHEVAWYDWSIDETRLITRVAAVSGDNPGVHLYPHKNSLVILRHDPQEGEATIVVWAAPPPRPPWPWSVPAGVAVGVLLTTAGVRLRRRPTPVV